MGLVVAVAVAEAALRASVRLGLLPRDRGFVAFLLQTRDARRLGYETLRGYTAAHVGRDSGLFRLASDADLGWEPTPNVKAGPIRINADGFRGADVPLAATQTVVRVAVLGDSQAFGLHLAEGDTLAGVLERELIAGGGGRTVQALNFGTPGYNTDQVLAVLRRKALRYRPDLVVLYYCFNDPEIGSRAMLLGRGPLTWSYLYLLCAYSLNVRTSMADLRAASSGLVDYYLRLHASAYFTRCAELIRRMARESEAHGARFYLVIAPEIAGFRSFDEYPYAEVHDRLRRLESGPLRVVDPLPGFRASRTAPRSLWASEYDTHLNAEATRLVGRACSVRILEDLRDAPSRPERATNGTHPPD
jgi:hypothetical protein